MRILSIAALFLLLTGAGQASGRQRATIGKPGPPALLSLVYSNPGWAHVLAHPPGPFQTATGGDRFRYVATERGLARSLDGGRTWTVHPVAATEPPVHTVIAEGALVWVGTPEGVYRSVDAGRTWTGASLGMTSMDVRLLYRTRTGTLFLASTGGDCALYRTRSDGNLWSCVVRGGMTVDTITTDADGGMLVTDGSRIFRSSDEGHTWERVGITPPAVQAIAARFRSFGSR